MSAATHREGWGSLGEMLTNQRWGRKQAEARALVSAEEVLKHNHFLDRERFLSQGTHWRFGFNENGRVGFEAEAPP